MKHLWAMLLLTLALALPASHCQAATDEQCIDYIRIYWGVTDVSGADLRDAINSHSYPGLPVNYKAAIGLLIAEADASRQTTETDWSGAASTLWQWAQSEPQASVLAACAMPGLAAGASLGAAPQSLPATVFAEAIASPAYSKQVSLYCRAREIGYTQGQVELGLDNEDLTFDADGWLVSVRDDTCGGMYCAPPGVTTSEFYAIAERHYQFLLALTDVMADADTLRRDFLFRLHGGPMITITPAHGYAPLTMTFDSSQSQPPAGHTYVDRQWMISPSTSFVSGVAVTKTCTAGGSAFLYLTQDDGQKVSQTTTFSVWPPLMTGQRDPYNARLFTFSGENNLLITSYTWDFGDGSATAAGRVVQHIYKADGNYRVKLSVAAAGSTITNEHYFRVGQPGKTVVSGTITEDQTWTKAGSPYEVWDATVAAGVHLTIAPGVTVKIGGGGSLLVNGTIRARGTAEEPIVFTSTTDNSVGGGTPQTPPAPGDWGHILVTGAGASGTFANCVVRYGGKEDWAAHATLACSNGGCMTVSNCTVAQSLTDGIYCEGVAGAQVTGCRVMDCAKSGIYLKDCPKPCISGCVVERTAVSGVSLEGCRSPRLSGNTFNDNTQWAACVTDPAGTLQFTSNKGSGNRLNGIRLCGTVSADSHWPVATGLPYVVSGELTVTEGTALRIDPGTVVKFAAGNCSALTVHGALIAEGTKEAPISFTSSRDSSVGGQTESGIAQTWGDWVRITISGAGASGTFSHCTARYGGGQPCCSWGPSAIFWAANGGRLSIQNCVIGASKSNGVYCENSPNLLITDSLVAGCAVYGIYLQTCASPVISGCTIDSCTSNASSLGSITMLDCPSPVLTNDTFTANRKTYAVSVIRPAGVQSLHGLEASDNACNGVQFADVITTDCTLDVTDGFPCILQLSVVRPGATLTLPPGTVAKLADRDSGLTVAGTLSAKGTEEKPIYLTSRVDDTVGGDTNNDGSATTPAPADWECIEVAGAGARADLAHCVVRYGGYGALRSAQLHCKDGGGLSVTNCTVTDSSGDGIVLDTAGQEIRNTIVCRNQKRGVYVNAAACHVTYCDLWQNAADGLASDTDHTGTFTADPLFVSITSGNLGLKEGSPCVDAGDPSMKNADGTRADIGALPFTGARLASQTAQAKIRPDGSVVSIADAVVTAGTDVFGSFLYMEDPGRVCGIRVLTSSPIPAGVRIGVTGPISTANGERQISASEITLGEAATIPAPLTLANHVIGGGNWFYDPANGSGQQGMAGGHGLNTTGLLVRSTGQFRYENESTFTLDDSSAGGVKCVVPAGVVLDRTWEYVTVTGISSCEATEQGLRPLILIRDRNDIQPVQ